MDQNDGNGPDSLAQNIGHENLQRATSFLILMARFVTIVFMTQVRVTPMHHLTIVVSSVASGRRR
jgi:hypothetical protein